MRESNGGYQEGFIDGVAHANEVNRDNLAKIRELESELKLFKDLSAERFLQLTELETEIERLKGVNKLPIEREAKNHKPNYRK